MPVSYTHLDVYKRQVIKLAKQTMTREDAIRTYGESVIKLIAIVDGNPISINHQNYKKIFVPMLTFAKGAEESYISEFIRTKDCLLYTSRCV